MEKGWKIVECAQNRFRQVMRVTFMDKMKSFGQDEKINCHFLHQDVSIYVDKFKQLFSNKRTLNFQ